MAEGSGPDDGGQTEVEGDSGDQGLQFQTEHREEHAELLEEGAGGTRTGIGMVG